MKFRNRSLAIQHGFNFIEFDERVNLFETRAELPGGRDFYEQDSIEIIKEAGPSSTYQAKKAESIVYGISVPSHAKNKDLAEEFVELFLSDTGRNAMEVKMGSHFLRCYCVTTLKIYLPG